MHVLVCTCSNVRQFDKITDMIQVCYHTSACTCWACILSTRGCFHRTVKIGRPMAAILFLGGIFALRAHCALLLDYVPPEEPPSTPLGNALRIS